jgi:hypothetical protein
VKIVLVLGCFGKVQAGYEAEYDDEDEHFSSNVPQPGTKNA